MNQEFLNHIENKEDLFAVVCHKCGPLQVGGTQEEIETIGRVHNKICEGLVMYPTMRQYNNIFKGLIEHGSFPSGK